MDNSTTQIISIPYPEWMQKKYDDVFIGARWNYASIEDVMCCGGVIHLFDTVNTWCNTEIGNIVWTDNVDHVTCPLCLRRKILYLQDFLIEEILQPISSLIVEVEGKCREFASESELAELIRIARCHPFEWRKMGSRF